MIKNKLESLSGSKFAAFKMAGLIGKNIEGGDPSYLVVQTDYFDRVFVRCTNGTGRVFATGDRTENGCTEFLFNGTWY